MCKFSTYREQACTRGYTVLWESLCSARALTEVEFAKILFSGIFLLRTLLMVIPVLDTNKVDGFTNALFYKSNHSKKWLRSMKSLSVSINGT